VPTELASIDINSLARKIYGNIAAEIQANYSNNFLAVLFKNPSMSKQVYEAAIK
jgi:hypothetical protein